MVSFSTVRYGSYRPLEPIRSSTCVSTVRLPLTLWLSLLRVGLAEPEYCGCVEDVHDLFALESSELCASIEPQQVPIMMTVHMRADRACAFISRSANDCSPF